MLITGPRLATIKLEGMTETTVFTVPALHAIIGIMANNRSTGTRALIIGDAAGGPPIFSSFSVSPNFWRNAASPLIMYDADHDLRVLASLDDWSDMSVDMFVFLNDLAS